MPRVDVFTYKIAKSGGEVSNLRLYASEEAALSHARRDARPGSSSITVIHQLATLPEDQIADMQAFGLSWSSRINTREINLEEVGQSSHSVSR